MHMTGVGGGGTGGFTGGGVCVVNADANEVV